MKPGDIGNILVIFDQHIDQMGIRFPMQGLWQPAPEELCARLLHVGTDMVAWECEYVHMQYIIYIYYIYNYIYNHIYI